MHHLKMANNNTEKYTKPAGSISMIMHKGGEINPKTGKLEGVKEIITQKEVKNLIVNTASNLMAYRMAPLQISTDSGIDVDTLASLQGLQYLAVGVGICQNENEIYDKTTNPVDTNRWDILNPPAESLTQTKLYGELYRKPFTTWSFLDSNDNVSTVPTNILKLSTTFLETEAVGPLTEMGIFGGDAEDWNAGAGRNTGRLFNHKTYGVWVKSADARLTISWKLVF